MIDKQLIKTKILAIQRDLMELEKFREYSFDEIAGSYGTHKIIERIMEIVINEAIDINQHIIVKYGKGNLPFNFKQSFLLLADIGIYPREFAETISKSVGIRNILVHQYRKLDEYIFYSSIKDCLQHYTQYCSYILEFLSKLEHS